MAEAIMRRTKWTLLAALCVTVGSSGAALADFKLGGTAVHAYDPENSSNQVVKIRTDIAPYFGTVSRRLNVKVNKLDDMVEFKAWFLSAIPEAPGVPGVQKTCFGGTPRVQLSIDTDGDGDADANALGYYGNPDVVFSGCPNEVWMYEDFTGAGDIAVVPPGFITCSGCLPSTGRTVPNEELEWDLTELAGDPCGNDPGTGLPLPIPLPPIGMFTWSMLEDYLNQGYPNHKICAGALVDDARGFPDVFPEFAELASGTAYYDLTSLGVNTWNRHSDTLPTYPRGFAMGCARPDHEDDEHEGDHDCDHDTDDDDHEYDKERRRKWGNNFQEGTKK
jgi:hypothetical protein